MLQGENADTYGIICSDGSVNTGELIGFKDNAPEEIKKSWEEYLKDRTAWDEIGDTLKG